MVSMTSAPHHSLTVVLALPCQEFGPCFSHSLYCGGGSCCFLLLRNTGVLTISPRRYCVRSSPYLDAHGEEDMGLKRGKPLTLSTARLQQVAALWAGDSLDGDGAMNRQNHLTRL